MPSPSDLYIEIGRLRSAITEAVIGTIGRATYVVGDMLYASGATTLTVLADVATGNAIISGGVAVAPAWGKIGLTTHVSGTLAVGNGGTGQTSGYGTHIGARVYNSGTISINNNNTTTLTFDTERYDTDTFHSTSSNTDRLTVPLAGKYLIIGNIGWAARSDYTLVLVRITHTDAVPTTTVVGNVWFVPPLISGGPTQQVSALWNCAAGDYFTLQAYQTNSATAATTILATSAYTPEFSIAYLGP